MNEMMHMPKYMEFAVQYAALLLCISIHESAHALSAHLLGDDTAKNQGRISLNPFVHIDIFGTVIFPLMAFFMNIPVIGWAKPVMVNTINLRDAKRDDILISASGPISNLFTAFLLLSLYPLISVLAESVPVLFTFYSFTLLINIYLALFNLIPIPPLDGSGILRGFLTDKMMEKYDMLRGYMGFILIYILMLSGVFRFISDLAGSFLVSLEIVTGIKIY
jgi:Zn-dependent protease